MNPNFASNSKARKTFDEVMVPNYTPSQVIPYRGEGSRVYDVEGKEYIDMGAGIAVTSLGHCHPSMVSALEDQAKKLWHMSNIFTNLPALELAEKLVKNTFAEKVFFCNSGAEANEAALKLARLYAHNKFHERKFEIISFNNSFHGRTFFTVCVGGQDKYKKGFGPIPEGIINVALNDIAAVKKHLSREKTAAVIVEPIQGEGGILSAQPEFLRELKKLCKENDVLLIFDEIQTGMGRTGSLYAYEAIDVVPDILTTAKGIGGGFPIGAMLTTTEIAAVLTLGTHGSTFGGNPLACAVASRVFDIINSQEVFEGVKRKRTLIEAELYRINHEVPFFDEIRGAGLLIGILVKDKWRGRAREFLAPLAEEGVLALVAGTDVLRLAPSLIIPDADILEAMRRMHVALKKFIV